MKRIALLALLVLVAVAVATYIAGEQTEVVVLTTVDEFGEPHDTNLWVVDYDGAAWVRVAQPQRQWYQRLLQDPHAQLTRGGDAEDVIASPQDSPEMHAKIDAAFAAKYGTVDWWYGLLLRRGSIPVRLDPVEHQY